MPLPRHFFVFGLVAAISAVGEGCQSTVQSPPTAQPFIQDETQKEAAHTQGFGKLPPIEYAARRGTVQLMTTPPSTPPYVTILRQRAGFPNQTELQHIGSALRIPGGVIGNQPKATVMNLEWTDDDGAHWTYHPEDRSLEFRYENAPTQPLTTSTLPTNAQVIQLTDEFLKTRGLQLQNYRDGLVDPDWNLWWFRSQAAGRCPDFSSLVAIRSIGASVPLLDPGPPVLPDASTARCLSPEFPAHLTVRYHALVDNQDVVDPSGKYVNGAEIVVDVIHRQIIAGRLLLTTNPERSDYPALSAPQILEALAKGGVTGVNGDVSITGYEIALSRVKDFRGNIPQSYLIPSLVAHGTQRQLDGTQSPATIVVPLLAQ